MPASRSPAGLAAPWLPQAHEDSGCRGPFTCLELSGQAPNYVSLSPSLLFVQVEIASVLLLSRTQPQAA